MESNMGDESIPDPFEVGDDELEDESPPASLPQRSEPKVGGNESPGVTQEISIDSGPQSQVNLAQELSEKSNPPLPPKVVAPSLPRPELGGNLQALLSPNLFLPIPEADPLKILLAKYVPDPSLRPQRDSSGEYSQTDLPTLITTNSWRATAKLARDRLLACDPNETLRILELWSLRLSSLARLRLYNQTAAECGGLFTALSATHPPEFREYLIQELLPLDLELCRARLRYWANDQVGYVDALMHITKRCRYMARRTLLRDGGTTSTKWLDKAARVSVVLASQLVEMKQYTTATRLLESMLKSGTPSPDLRSTLASIYFQIGDLGSASRHLEVLEREEGVGQDIRTSNLVLRATFLGNWEQAIQLLQARREEAASQDKHVQRAIDANNLSVALLNLGRLGEAISVLEDAFRNMPSITVVAEPLIFNLATMYELKSNTAMNGKLALLLQVAQWSGDGVRHTVLKLG